VVLEIALNPGNHVGSFPAWISPGGCQSRSAGGNVLI
jgi:hypothetical protein